MNDKELLEFKDRISRLAEHYSEFFIAVKTPDGELAWKSSDKTWAIGLCHRYITCADAADSFDETDRSRRRLEG